MELVELVEHMDLEVLFFRVFLLLKFVKFRGVWSNLLMQLLFVDAACWFVEAVLLQQPLTKIGSFL